MADLIEEIEALLIILLHLEAIVECRTVEISRSQAKRRVLGKIPETRLLGFRVLAPSQISRIGPAVL